MDPLTLIIGFIVFKALTSKSAYIAGTASGLERRDEKEAKFEADQAKKIAADKAKRLI